MQKFLCWGIERFKKSKFIPYLCKHRPGYMATCGKGKASEHRGNHLFEQNDLARLKYLPEDWWYFLNQHGEGLAVDFPLKARPILSWSSDKYVKKDGQLVKVKKFPIEKICITVVHKAYSYNSKTFCGDKLITGFIIYM